MKNILDKYKRLRPQIKDGDIILFHGTGIIANIIQWCDNSYYNHVGVVFEKLGTLYIMDANANGVQCDRLSWRINKYRKGGDFTIVRPLNSKLEIEYELKNLLVRSENWIKYDFFNGFKELLNSKFNLSLLINFNDKREICTDFLSQYQSNLGLLNDNFKKVRISFPQDTLRYSTEKVLIIN
jgi:hypothetical protein